MTIFESVAIEEHLGGSSNFQAEGDAFFCFSVVLSDAPIVFVSFSNVFGTIFLTNNKREKSHRTFATVRSVVDETKLAFRPLTIGMF